MSDKKSAIEARQLAADYEKQGGHARVVEFLRAHADHLDSDAPSAAADAARYRRLATLPDNDWVSFTIPTGNSSHPLVLAPNRKPWLDDLLDKMN